MRAAVPSAAIAAIRGAVEPEIVTVRGLLPFIDKYIVLSFLSPYTFFSFLLISVKLSNKTCDFFAKFFPLSPCNLRLV